MSNLLNQENGNTPLVLYHYTSIDTLFRIIENYDKESDTFTLRATSTPYLNDSKEGKLGLKQFAKAISLYEEEFGQHGNSNMKENIKHWKKKIKSNFGNQSYVFSLSDSYDCLPMWSMYGDNGSGVAIGLYTPELKQDNWYLLKCLYQKKEFYSLVKEAIDNEKLFNLDLDMRNINLPDSDKFHSIRNLILAFKHKEFDYEKEYRLVPDAINSAFSQNIKNRCSGNLIIPFREFQVKKSALREVLIGPTANPKLSMVSLINYLNRKGFTTNSETNDMDLIQINNSSIPFQLLK